MAAVPMPARGDRTAPKFDSSKPRELRRYFADLEFLFGVSSITDHTEKKKHATRYLSVDDQDVWETLPSFASAAHSYDQFKAEVLKLYSGNDEDRRFSLNDLDALVGQSSRTGVHSKLDLTTFYRQFLLITAYLISKDRLSVAEQSRAFFRAMQPQSLATAIQQRLQIKQPDIHPEDPYALEDLYEAAEFALAGSSGTHAITAASPSPSAVASASADVKPDPGIAALVGSVAELIKVLASQNKSSGGNNQANNSASKRPDGCSYCSENDHYINQCPHVAEDVNTGKCRRNTDGRVVLPSGAFVPRAITGKDLRARVNEWHNQNPGQLAQAQLVVEIAAEPAISSSHSTPIAHTYTLTDEEREEALQREILAIQTRRQAKRALEASRDTPDRTIPPTKPVPAAAAPAPAQPAPPVPPAPAPPVQNAPAPHPHPFAGARDAAYAPPAARNFGAPPAKAPAYRSTAPVYNEKDAKDIFNASLDSSITIPMRKLLSIAPEVRAQFREVTTSRRTPAKDAPAAPSVDQLLHDVLPFSGFEPDTLDEQRAKDACNTALLDSLPASFTHAASSALPPGAFVVPDPYSVYYDSGEPIPDDLVVSVNTCAIRSVLPVIDHREVVECIVDGGSQIVAMSEAVCHDLALPYDPRVVLRMQSANGSITPSLGLARNVPFTLGDITLYLQVHVVRNAAYDVLLGHPFHVLTQSIVRTFANEDQTITICDPNSGKIATVPTVPRGSPRFFQLEELIPDQGELALVISFDEHTDTFVIESTADLVSDTPAELQRTYLSACTNLGFDTDTLNFSRTVVQPTSAASRDSTRGDESIYLSPFSRPSSTFRSSVVQPALPSSRDSTRGSYSVSSYSCSASTPIHAPVSHSSALPPLVDVYAKKKYKPVAQKVRPVLGTVPDQFRIERRIIGDPLADMPQLNPTPPDFVPTGRYTAERRDIIDTAHPGDFLWPEERKLMHHFMCIQNGAFAWQDSERGSFRPDFFPPVDIPVMPHTPWVQRNIPIPPGIYDQVCKLIRAKIDAGVYEPSNSSYRSRWFCVVKKDGTSLRIVHSLEPLNAVTIQHSGVIPFTEQLAEHFAGRACGAMLDLYVGYDERLLAPSSRDYTTFQTPYGAQRLVTLPMGWSNSVPIFHDDVTYILQPEIPEYTWPYIDDVPGRGPATTYQLADGSYETIPENPGIRRFVWEHFGNLLRIVQRMKYCGGTFSGYKSVLCAESITVVGHVCTPAGRIPDKKHVAKIINWGPCRDLSEVRAFLGTIGVVRVFIRNFALRAHDLIKLTRKDMPFVFGPAQITAQEDLKLALVHSPALRKLDYHSNAPVILAVDTCPIAIGALLAQCDLADLSRRFYSRFGSITLNERKARFSQAKLELYGLYRTLRAWKVHLIGLRNLVVEVDARYIKGMLSNPDLAPSASINRWILAILTFHFTLVHVPGVSHGPDGLSRRPAQPGDEPEPEDDFDDWIDQVHGFLHMINDTPFVSRCQYTIAIFAAEVAPDGQDPPPSLDYSLVPRADLARLADARIDAVQLWHRNLERPRDMSDDTYTKFVRYCMEFYLAPDGQLWRKDTHSHHKLVIPPHRRLFILRSAHDDVGHKGVYATRALVSERFWWPHMGSDIVWFVKTCHLCQVRQTRQVLIPPTVAVPAPLFAKMYMDTMHMPPSGGFKYIVHGRCSLTTYPEFRMLRRETAQSIGDWIFQDILCRWGTLCEIVTDNGSPFIKALDYIAKKYHVHHIRISGYNSRANGLIERPHYDVREALFKAADGDENKWNQATYSVFWAERVTLRKRMGCSPYFAATGTHPLLPLDISEATYLRPPPESVLSTTDLIAARAVALQKRRDQLAELHSTVYETRLRHAARFEIEHAATLRDYDFKRGDLVLMRNTAIEKSLSKKMRKRYLGPLIVISRNRGGAYILCELDGSVFHRPIAAFRVIPYFARTSIPIPPLDDFIDISTERLRELEQSTLADPEDSGDDYESLAPE